MFRFKILLACMLSVVVVVGLSGCAKDAANGSGDDSSTEDGGNGEGGGDEGSTSQHDEHGDHDHADHEHGDHDHEHADTQPVDIEANLAQLSDEDRALVDLQGGVCLVDGEDHKLGAMGVPHKVTINGVDVMLCCEGCEPALKEDPEKFLAKLEKKE